MTSLNQLQHESVFRQAWVDPGNTSFELPPVDVNKVLAERYSTSRPLTFTRTMMWDMEIRKAWRPDRYISSVVCEGSAQSWGQSSLTNGIETFVRSSQQRLWLEPIKFGLVLEQVCLNNMEKKVTFIGVPEYLDRDSNLLRAGVEQPIFYVEHSVGGDETRPQNKWRVVHLTDRPEPRLTERFAPMAKDVWLPEFIEVYIRNDLNIKLTRQ
ncbi:MAG: hypothetical protein ACR2PA_11610 [Hyphomicrobiaceae bacterium]